MNVFLIHAGDDDFSRELPRKLARSPSGPHRVKLMAFPPLGIQTLAPVLRQHGHQVRMFDTCHPEMKPEHLAHAVSQQRPDVIGISFLSTTTYPAAKSVAARLKSVAPATPIIVGGPFATANADRILADSPQIDCVGVGEGEELLPDYLSNLHDPGGPVSLPRPLQPPH
jgi:anaerobic magnesium-protoporphyrin IX monomethyl ester cyclase